MGFDDTCFLSGNLCQSVTKELCVVEADICDDGQFWANDVGAVKTSAKSYFYDSDIYFLLLEIEKSQGGCQFEERRMEGFEKVSFLLNEVYDALLTDRFAVDTNALSEIH